MHCGVANVSFPGGTIALFRQRQLRPGGLINDLWALTMCFTGLVLGHKNGWVGLWA